jgi:micrococcal nuclease
MTTQKISIAVMTAMLVAGGYGGYTLIKEKDLEGLRTDDVPLYQVSQVFDGDTFKVFDNNTSTSSVQVVRIADIDTPEQGECFYQESKDALKKLIEGKEVELRKDITAIDEFERLLRHVILPNASTVKNNVLVSEYMVAGGYAVPVSNTKNLLYFRSLVIKRDEAIKKGLGMWGGGCDYKVTERSQNDVPASSPECTIKGNISAGVSTKTYFVDGCLTYNQVKIDPARGEKYFCSESEAVKAGYKKALNCP